jgi:hypothetical protein
MERDPFDQRAILPLCLTAILMLGCHYPSERAAPLIINATDQNIDVAMSFPISRRSQERLSMTIPPGGKVHQSVVRFVTADDSKRPTAHITSGNEQCRITFSEKKQQYEIILVNGTLVARPIPLPQANEHAQEATP